MSHLKGEPKRIARALLIDRDGIWCRACAKELTLGDITIDHIIPFSAGGSNALENLQLLCKKCHQEKDNPYGMLSPGQQKKRYPHFTDS